MLNKNNIYKQKYFKYKNKYLELKNNLSGGSLKTAEDYYSNFLSKNKNIINTLYENDGFLKNKMEENGISPSSILDKSIFEIIVKGVDPKIVDGYIKIYLNQKMGDPNSIENKGRYIDSFNKLTKLRNNKEKLKDDIPSKFDSLKELEDFITANQENLLKFDSKTLSKKKKGKEYETIKIEGEADVEIILDTNDVIIYKPTTVAGSKYYGMNTRWCTASTNNNQFDYYNEKGPLYIIKSKKEPIRKFQLHLKTGNLMDEQDKPISIEEVSRVLADIHFSNWFNEQLYKDLTINNKKVIITSQWVPFFTEKYNDLITELTFGEDFNQPIGNSLDKLTSLQQLTFGEYFNQPLGNSLDNLTSLQQLTFGRYFDQPLGNSLDKLTSLQQLTFGEYFNQPLDNSLDKLTNLRQLSFSKFDKPLGNSLDKLTSLQQLTLSDFNQPLDNSLDNLTSLRQLTFGMYFGQPLGNSLDKLTSLQQLTFGEYFGQPLGNSLDKLTSLQQLTFGEYFNQPLGNSLDKLTSLQQLTFGYKFNQPHGNSLDKLTSLEQLTIGSYFCSEFDQPLGNSLDKLTSLQQLTFGEYFNQPLGNSLDKLTSLQQLTIPISYRGSIYGLHEKKISILRN
jgi:hypothetical protein